MEASMLNETLFCDTHLTLFQKQIKIELLMELRYFIWILLLEKLF